MAHGLKIYDSSGVQTLDVSDKITRLRYTTVATAGNNGSVVLSDITGKDTCQFGVVLEASKEGHTVSRSGTTISWTAQSNIYSSGDTLIVVFLYS